MHENSYMETYSPRHHSFIGERILKDERTLLEPENIQIVNPTPQHQECLNELNKKLKNIYKSFVILNAENNSKHSVFIEK